MRRKTIAFLRWIAFGIGVGSGAIGAFVPSTANLTNYVCWVCMFIMCAPYPAKD